MRIREKTPLGWKAITMFINFIVLLANVWGCVHVIYDMDCVNTPILLIATHIFFIIIFMIIIIRDSIIYAIEDMNFE